MTVLGKIVALGSASAATASVAWMVGTSTGYGGAGQPPGANAVAGPVVCVGQDSILRLMDEGKTCADEQERQRRLLLRVAARSRASQVNASVLRVRRHQQVGSTRACLVDFEADGEWSGD
jgi:hypothetical protein